MSSDLHGRYEPLLAAMREHEWDVWLDCGDFLPHPNWPGERGPGIAEQQEREQASWWRSERLSERLSHALRDRPAVLLVGNHDFFDYRHLVENAHALEWNAPVTIGSTRFAGFGQVPHMHGIWRGEILMEGFAPLVESVLAEQPQILATHAPPSGILDDPRYQIHSGIVALTRAIQAATYGAGYYPPVHVFGHVHKAGGKSAVFGPFRFFNVACRAQILDLGSAVPDPS